jgi:hypothetical protein
MLPVLMCPQDADRLIIDHPVVEIRAGQDATMIRKLCHRPRCSGALEIIWRGYQPHVEAPELAAQYVAVVKPAKPDREVEAAGDYIHKLVAQVQVEAYSRIALLNSEELRRQDMRSVSDGGSDL